MALISVNLAILNLLPIPVLDGGQFLFLLAEVVLRRPPSLKLRAADACRSGAHRLTDGPGVLKRHSPADRHLVGKVTLLWIGGTSPPR
jgi:hypothetical protein